MAVCSYCRSTLVRDGESLRRIGQSAELFNDHSPLQLGVTGRYQGEGFALVGRLQMASEGGTWNEWHALFDNGRSGWLSEDNGGHVIGFDTATSGQPIPFDWTQSKPGQSAVIDGRAWTVASVVNAGIQAAQGELAFLPDFKRRLTVVELRNPQGEVLSLDTRDDPPKRSLGRAVELSQLALVGLRGEHEGSVAGVKGQAMACPNCGAALAPKLDSSKSITCGSCRSVVDISKGLGADLAYFRQDNALEPLIALGTTGVLTIGGKKDNWQVVGYQERCDEPASRDDEQTFWREYLLYNRRNGFAFLVDAEDGWSVVRPITGVPSARGDKVEWQGVVYRQRFAYTAKTTYVLGEFYWPVYRHQRTFNTDFVGQLSNARSQLNRERTGDEIVWSGGTSLEASAVISAFRVNPADAAQFKRGSSLLSRTAGSYRDGGVPSWLIIALIILVVVIAFSCSDECDQVRETYGSASTEYQQCRSYRSSGGGGGSYHGGSWGGYSSGGFHK
ncbi:MAG: DUF4178 domain-containing protein [Rubrivivax sp.]|nr:MAG: DUF4178 domain-containing protein [Rubrivivax sp.]